MVEDEPLGLDSKAKKAHSLKAQIQYWIEYDIYKKMFIDLMKVTK